MITNSNINSILVKHDPIGLIRIGAPDDEYSEEAKLIISAIEVSKLMKWDNDLTVEGLKAMVYSIFCIQFDPKIAGKSENFLQIANDIFDLIQ